MQKARILLNVCGILTREQAWAAFGNESVLTIAALWLVGDAVRKWDVSAKAATISDACEVLDGAGHCLRVPLATQTTPYHVGRTTGGQAHPTRPTGLPGKKVHEKVVLKKNKTVYMHFKKDKPRQLGNIK